MTKAKTIQASRLDKLTIKNTAIIQNLKKRLYAYALLNNEDEENLNRFYTHACNELVRSLSIYFKTCEVLAARPRYWHSKFCEFSLNASNFVLNSSDIDNLIDIKIEEIRQRYAYSNRISSTIEKNLLLLYRIGESESLDKCGIKPKIILAIVAKKDPRTSFTIYQSKMAEAMAHILKWYYTPNDGLFAQLHEWTEKIIELGKAKSELKHLKALDFRLAEKIRALSLNGGKMIVDGGFLNKLKIEVDMIDANPPQLSAASLPIISDKPKNEYAPTVDILDENIPRIGWLRSIFK